MEPATLSHVRTAGELVAELESIPTYAAVIEELARVDGISAGA